MRSQLSVMRFSIIAPNARNPPAQRSLNAVPQRGRIVSLPLGQRQLLDRFHLPFSSYRTPSASAAARSGRPLHAVAIHSLAKEKETVLPTPALARFSDTRAIPVMRPLRIPNPPTSACVHRSDSAATRLQGDAVRESLPHTPAVDPPCSRHVAPPSSQSSRISYCR